LVALFIDATQAATLHAAIVGEANLFFWACPSALLGYILATLSRPEHFQDRVWTMVCFCNPLVAS
jgi:hypothetical protein